VRVAINEIYRYRYKVEVLCSRRERPLRQRRRCAGAAWNSLMRQKELL